MIRYVVHAVYSKGALLCGMSYACVLACMTVWMVTATLETGMDTCHTFIRTLCSLERSVVCACMHIRMYVRT